MISWVVEAAKQVPNVAEILVATDDARVAEAAQNAGAEAVMTPPDCPTGTDRIRSAMKGREGDLILNIQGDWPTVRPESAAAAIRSLVDDPACAVGTCCVPLRSREEFEASHNVKVVVGQNGRALYFSRAPIPSLARLDAKELAKPGFVFGHKHYGLYVYRREALEAFGLLRQSPHELRESLEQLRFLENGFQISCAEVPHDSVGVDIAEEIPRAEEALRSMGKQQV
jgi:3-deoxy-manno-octulosonate cytidylyltransferase (CMP-KDO synthetase)